MHIDIAALTSKGQFTIPGKFRDLLRLSAGSKMIIVCDGEYLLLKPIKQADCNERWISVEAFVKAFSSAIQQSKESNDG